MRELFRQIISGFIHIKPTQWRARFTRRTTLSLKNSASALHQNPNPMLNIIGEAYETHISGS
jgi:hypothetical protein